MADNPVYQSATPATLPAGTTPATDEVTPAGASGAGHVQYVKLVDGTANGTAILVIDANGADVDVTRLPALPAGTNNIGDVDVLTVPAPLSTTGNGTAATALRVTIASDSTGQVTLATGANTIGSLAANQSVNVAQINAVTPLMGNGASGTGAQRVTIANDSTGVLATVSTVTNLSQLNGAAIAMNTGVRSAGTQRVTIATDDVVAASQSGTWNIGTVTPGTAATNLGKAEDAGHTTGDVGVMALAVRNDAGTSLAGTDLDYAPLSVNSSGALYVTGGGGGTQYVEDAAAAADPTGTVPILVRKDTPATTVSTDGDNIAQRGSNYGAAYVTLIDNAGSFVSVGGGTQYDEDTVSTAADKITMAGVVRKDTAATLVDTDGDRTQLQVSAAGRLWVDASGAAVPVTDNGASLTVDAPVSTPVFVRLSDGSSAIATLPVSVASGAATIGKAEDVASANADVGVPAMAVRKASPANTSDTDGDYEMLQMSAGRVWATANIDQMNGVAVTMGNGVSGTGVQRVTIASDSTGTVAATQSGTWTVQPGNTANTTPWLTTQTPATSGGLSVFNATSGDGSTALTNSAQSVKGSAGQLFGWYIYNPNATVAYVPIYNTASGSVTVGTTNPLMVLGIPATSAANVEFTNGIAFGTAISVAACTTAAGNTALGSAIDANFFYK